MSGPCTVLPATRKISESWNGASDAAEKKELNVNPRKSCEHVQLQRMDTQAFTAEFLRGSAEKLACCIRASTNSLDRAGELLQEPQGSAKFRNCQQAFHLIRTFGFSESRKMRQSG